MIANHHGPSLSNQDLSIKTDCLLKTLTLGILLVLKLAASHVQAVYLKIERVRTNLNLTFER